MIVSSLGLLIFYYLRFKQENSKEIIEYIKWIGIILILAYPWTLFAQTTPWLMLRASTLPILTAIYVYDRWIIKPENMKKYLVTLIAQTLLIVLLLMYAFVQKAESDALRQLADEQMKMARQNQEECAKAIRKFEHTRQE